jgi:hypothetical protein
LSVYFRNYANSYAYLLNGCASHHATARGVTRGYEARRNEKPPAACGACRLDGGPEEVIRDGGRRPPFYSTCTLRIGGGTRLEGADMKLIAEYVERAEQLEKLADGEADAVLKSALLKQAMAYRTLAHKRATQFARQPPTGSS